MEELESYGKQVEEFQTFGDMSEINRYLKKSQALDSKLQIAADKVSLWLNLTSCPISLYLLNRSSRYLAYYQFLSYFIVLNQKYRNSDLPIN